MTLSLWIIWPTFLSNCKVSPKAVFNSCATLFPPWSIIVAVAPPDKFTFHPSKLLNGSESIISSCTWPLPAEATLIVALNESAKKSPDPGIVDVPKSSSST